MLWVDWHRPPPGSCQPRCQDPEALSLYTTSQTTVQGDCAGGRSGGEVNLPAARVPAVVLGAVVVAVTASPDPKASGPKQPWSVDRPDSSRAPQGSGPTDLPYSLTSTCLAPRRPCRARDLRVQTRQGAEERARCHRGGGERSPNVWKAATCSSPMESLYSYIYNPFPPSRPWTSWGPHPCGLRAPS